MLVWRNEELLLIERRRPPAGYAPPAGHVDEDGTFLDAARRELEEEVGIVSTHMELVAQGVRNNPCRRDHGNWHYWKIYSVSSDASDVRLSQTEAASSRWCDVDELLQMQIKTRAYVSGEISAEEWLSSPGLEPIWADWLEEIGVLPSIAPPKEPVERSERCDQAREHAWNWFSYHAGQRQAVFRFFLILVGAALAGYISAAHDRNYHVAFILAVMLPIVSALFWRLDQRSVDLIKLAERALKKAEEYLSDNVGWREIRLAELADQKPGGGYGLVGFFSRRVYSFRQIYQIIYSSVMVVGIILMLVAVSGWWGSSKEQFPNEPPAASGPASPR